ncbi:MAG TPA: TSUP family transporter [Rubricoccaceae bacterium]|jgi:hypothetical protein
MPVSPLSLAVLCTAAAVAGLIDAVVGGGGLVQTPALFVLLPGAPVAAILGTNKAAGVWGTSAAAVTYARRVPVDVVATVMMALAAAAAAWVGAHAVGLVSREAFRPLLAIAIVGLGGYTLARKDFGAVLREGMSPRARRAAGVAVGLVVGFYDGFFGPGGGALFVFGLVTVAGLDVLRASASARIVNVATNVAALAVFIAAGHVLWAVALPMAACNLAGGLAGSRLALRHGAGFVRIAFVAVLSLLLARLLWEMAIA